MRYAIVLDFEATCEQTVPPEPQEIIEFPSVLVELATGKIIDTFESFVRPTANPRVSDFCTALTSITQRDVDPAPIFPMVLSQHEAWMEGHGLTPDNTVMVTCGDWDLDTMLPAQLKTCGIGWVHPNYRQWMNVKITFKVKYPKGTHGMARMLKMMKLELLGRHHRGIDDCHNIARLTLALQRAGAKIVTSNYLDPKRYPPVNLILDVEGERQSMCLNDRSLLTLQRLARGVFAAPLINFRLRGAPLTQDRQLLELRTSDVIEASRD